MDAHKRIIIALDGMDVQEIGGEFVNPTGMFNALIDCVAAITGIPQRILMGSERGELASTMDTETWVSEVAARQLDFAGPSILRPTIQRLIDFGVLPQPQGDGFIVEWPSLFQQEPTDTIRLAEGAARTLQMIAPENRVADIVAPGDFIRVYLPELYVGDERKESIPTGDRKGVSGDTGVKLVEDTGEQN